MDVSLEYSRIDIPSLHQLIDVLGGEKVFVSLPVPFDSENGFINLRFKRNLDLDVIPDRGHTGKTVSLIIFHWDSLGCLGASAVPFRIFTLHFPQVALPPQEALI